MDPNQITARIGTHNVEYRRRATFQRQMTKTEFDTAVYDYYREHHPLDADNPDNERKAHT